MSSVFVITGGSRGIGAATARALGACGGHVAVGYHRDRDAAEHVVGEIEQRGGRGVAAQADVGTESGVAGLFAAVDEHFGRLDGLVNAAGYAEPQSRVDAMTADRLARLFRVNVIGSFLCAREALRRLSSRHGGAGGSIVNLSSAAARLGSPGEYVDYAASKGAIDTFTLGLAREVAAEGVRVNAVRPGLIETGFHAAGGDPGRIERLSATIPLQRAGSADEVAAAIVWLLSDKASYTTGALVDVSGGR